MNMLTTVRCRTAQSFIRLGRKLHPVKKQVLETGAGAVFAVGQLLRDRRLRKPLVVPGAGEGQTRFKLIHTLEEEAVDRFVYEGLPATPTAADAEEIALAWLQEDCDCFIALGDDEVLDAVKAAAARSVSRGRTVLAMAGFRRVPRRKLPPVIVVPTVGGSGAASLSAAVVADEQATRIVIEDESLMPPVAVLDPELLADAPRDKVADAGLSGLCLAVEAFLAAPYGDSRTQQMAAEAAEYLFTSLEPCWNSGGTVKERSDLLTATRLCGWAATAAGGGYARALIRAAQTVCGLDFRTACGAILPAVLEKYGNYAHNRLGLLAVLADVADGGSRSERSEALVERIRGMVFRLGLPDTLEGVTAGQAAEIADIAAATANPRYVSPVVWTAEDCKELILRLCTPEKS